VGFEVERLFDDHRIDVGVEALALAIQVALRRNFERIALAEGQGVA